ncbi:MAG: hypothetical protein IJC53_01595 [Clostridia bacterium]|nr:hypothetical protein [Clostridia bacterium]
MSERIPQNARINPEHIADESVCGTLESLADAGIPVTFANLLKAPALLRGEGNAAPAVGEVFPEIAEEKRIPELFPPSCGGPQGWLSGMACDLELFPLAVEGDFSVSGVLRTADGLSVTLTPASSRLSGPYAAALAVFMRAAAELCAAGGGAPTLCRASFPAAAEGIAGLCAVIDAALAFNCELQAEEGEASVTIYAPVEREAAESFRAAGNPVYFLAAPCCPDSLPDLDGIPAAHALFRRLAAEGRVLSARAVGTAGPAEAILSLCGGSGFKAESELDIFAFLLLNFGGLVMETAEEIPGALYIGRVTDDGQFIFPDGRGAKLSDLAAYRVAARRAWENMHK